MRRIHFTTPTKDIQLLKEVGSSNFVVPSMTEDHSFIFTQKSTKATIKARLWAMFANDTGDGIKLYASLENDRLAQVSSGSCTFRVYLVGESIWDRTLLDTVSGTASGRAFVANLTEADLSAQEITGERTLYVEADLYRRGKVYKVSQHFNHIGIWDSHLRLKNRVDFIELEVI